jgi:hypothetical protein
VTAYQVHSFDGGTVTNETNGLRAIAASVLAATVSCAVLGALARYAHAPWLAPTQLFGGWTRGSATGSWVLCGAIATVFGLMYACWFDPLLRGSAPVRGLKFGGAMAVWSAVGLGVMQGFGPLGLRAPQPGLYLLATAAGALTLGVVVGVAYGAGRKYDEYLWGMGYGLADRHSRV